MKTTGFSILGLDFRHISDGRLNQFNVIKELRSKNPTSFILDAGICRLDHPNETVTLLKISIYHENGAHDEPLAHDELLFEIANSGVRTWKCVF